MKNMAMSKEAAKEQYLCAPSDPGDENLPRYPYGLCISIEDEQIEALGIQALPEAGQTLMITARVQVKSVSQHKMQGGEKERCMSLQIIEMDIGPDTGKPTPESKLYADSD